MLENILVGAIILVAAAYTIYRVVIKRSCSCGDSCGCSTNTKNGCCGGSGKTGGCCCGSDANKK